MNVLVTGGTGYIGSFASLCLMQAGWNPVLLDNLCNSKRSVLDRLAALGGRPPVFVEGDVRDGLLLDRVLREHGITAVIHFAGLKAVGESATMPLEYYDCNVNGSLSLLRAMARGGVRTLIFSSSATVYAESTRMPLDEGRDLAPVNVYGRTKHMVEDMMRDLAASAHGWSLTALRYFNPVGAHPSGTMGEDPRGVPNNLMPYLAQVAVGRRERLSIFGDDYPTPDGTGVRDYIHVMDLADGHVAALKHALASPGFHVFNLGTGRGHSVREMLSAFSRAVGRDLPFAVAPRRSGDLAAYWADASLAARSLGWTAQRGVDAMCADAWRWQCRSPEGYPD